MQNLEATKSSIWPKKAFSKKNPQPIPKEEDVDHVAAEVEQIDIKVKMHLNWVKMKWGIAATLSKF